MTQPNRKIIESNPHARCVTFWGPGDTMKWRFPIASFIRFHRTYPDSAKAKEGFVCLEFPGFLMNIFGNELALDRIDGLNDQLTLHNVRVGTETRGEGAEAMEVTRIIIEKRVPDEKKQTGGAA
jgi:hypothetical protein